MRHSFWWIMYWLYAWWLGLCHIRRTVLGGKVRYKGGIWTISNWADSPSSTLMGPNGEREECVPRDDFKPVISIAQLWHRISFIREWWMRSWHCIYVHRRLHPEMYKGRHAL